MVLKLEEILLVFRIIFSLCSTEYLEQQDGVLAMSQIKLLLKVMREHGVQCNSVSHQERTNIRPRWVG